MHITVDNKALSIKFGEDGGEDPSNDLSGSNNYVSFIDGGLGDDKLSGGENEHNLFCFSGNDFGRDIVINPSPKSEGFINSGDIISFINFVLRRPTDDVELREGLTDDVLVRPTFENESLELSTNDNGASVTINNAAYLDIGIRSSHGDVENFIYALSSPDRELRGTDLPDIIFGRGGDDTIKGLAGNDEIVGGEGDDTIDAGYGDDYIEGGKGGDTLTGNGGLDVFVATINGGDTDIITDFAFGDKIRVDVIDPSNITDLASLYEALDITVTNDSDHGADGNNDTIITFQGQDGASDYQIVLEDFIEFLNLTDFDII